jgi:Ras-related GTP-binding protein C/D
MQDALEDFPYTSIQREAPHLNFSDQSVLTHLQDNLMAEIRFDMTSVHDVSLREAWSKVIQGVMEMLPSVESLLLNFTEVGYYLQ